MTIVWVLLPIALLLAAGFICVFVWGVRSGQYDDLTTPAYQMLRKETPDDASASKPLNS